MICSNCNADFEGERCPKCGIAVTTATTHLLNAAATLLKEGLPDQAIESLERAIAADPRSYEAHSLLGAAYMRQEEFQLAGHHFERAVWLDSGRAAARYNLAVAYRATGRIEDAIRQVKAALEKDPHHEKSRALLRDLERKAASAAAEPEAGAAENRPRAAAPHLKAVHVPGWRLSYRLRVTLGAAAAFTVLLIGAAAYAEVFALLTSPQLLGRDAVMWAQLPYAFGGIIFVAGIVAASFQARGWPAAGALGGFAGLPAAVALLMAREGEPITAKIILGAAVGGAIGVAAVETFGKYTRVGEFRRTLLWAAIAAAMAYVVVGYVRQGSLRGYVTRSTADELGQPVMVRVPDARIMLQDPLTGRTYATTSVNAPQSHRPATAQGRYHLRGMPVGRYALTCIEPGIGAHWEGEVSVDYAIVQGNELEIALTTPLDKARLRSPRR